MADLRNEVDSLGFEVARILGLHTHRGSRVQDGFER